MMEVLNWCGVHPILSFFFMAMLTSAFCYPFYAIGQAIVGKKLDEP